MERLNYEKILFENLSEGAFSMITKSEKDFADWIESIEYQSKRCDELFSELKKYEDAEEQGLLLRLPCKVGDTVYAISTFNDTSKVYECIVKFIKIDSSEEPYIVAHCTELNLGVTLYFSSFGKTVFLTKEQAEQALKQRGE